jgi:glycosyltransferase involved in cell wall biosynthesis
LAYIELILPDLRAGGFERVRTLLAQEFIAAGHRVGVTLLRRRGELLDQLPDGVSVHSLEVDRGREALRPLAAHFREAQPDAVLAGLWPLTAITAAALKLSRHKCRLVLSEHNHLSRQYLDWGMFHSLSLRTSLSFAHRAADSSVAVSQGVSTDVEALARLPKGKVRAISNPIVASHARYDELSKAELIWEAPKGVRILAVGTLKTQKNFELLLRAFARLDLHNKTLMIVGEGPERARIENLACELGVRGQVRMAGFQKKIAAFYQTADLFVLSSNYEGMPNVLGEALAAGTNVVATDCPSGPKEILDSGKYGRLTVVGDVEALHLAIDSALANPLPASLLVSRAQMFAPERIAHQYLQELLP